MTRKLFGTDGVRGVAGEFLSAELALALARAATRQSGAERPQVLIVRDTRESGEMLQAAVAAGVSAAGGDALLGGVLPTPAAPLLLARYGFDLAAVLSASHNPYQDNGIKFFASDGYKLSDEAELQIERELEREGQASSGRPHGSARDRTGARAEGRAGGLSARAAHALLRARPRRDGRDAGLCQRRHLPRGAGDLPAAGREGDRRSPTRRTGATSTTGCGSTHVERLAERVLEGGHAWGSHLTATATACSRWIAAEQVVDGDELMALAALQLQQSGRLTGNGVVVTVMTNYGFHAAMERAGVAVATTNVGDRYVLEELRARGWVLGGEQSGHLIEMGFNRTGDGIAGALLTLEALAGRDLSERDAMAKLPQRLVNVRVRDRGALEGAREVREAVSEADDALKGRGRVLVRPSGTEPLVRVMVEAPTDEEAEEVCTRLVELVGRELGQ